MRLAKSIGMDRDEQVGLDTARLLHPRGERHEIIVVPRQHRAHAGLGVENDLELAGDRQRHVLFIRSAFADCAGIFAAMTGIDGDRDPPHTASRLRSEWWRGGRRLCGTGGWRGSRRLR